MQHKQWIALGLAGTMCAALAGCGGGSAASGGDADTFGYWMGTSESTEYYLTYNDNPVVKYLTNCMTYADANGEQKNIKIDFQSAPAGKESDNFNTLLSTSSYPDILDTSYGGNLVDMYNAGQILDLTDFVETEMPNYKAYMEAHPEVKKYCTNVVDGEIKYLKFANLLDSIALDDQFCGYCYRRDWLVKYGVQPDSFTDPMTGATTANPNAGKAFNGYYSLDIQGNEIHEDALSAAVNGDSWVDDVVFPSGSTAPLYISDWEWMFEIFENALGDQGITDGYVTSVYYAGYSENGELATGFGGISPCWYRDGDTCQFGGVSDGFKTYLTCLNSWWDKGWIDQRFRERSSDLFFKIDDTTVRQGKVGLWLGSLSQLDSRMANAELPYTQGCVVFGAAQPINDVYGDASVQLKTPVSMYLSTSLFGGGICITDKAKDKDLTLLVHFIDSLYGAEGAKLRTFGLTGEQAKECGTDLYDKYGLSDGTYIEQADGKIQWTDIMAADNGGIQSAMTANRLIGLRQNSAKQSTNTATHIHSQEQWLKYEATGFLGEVNSRMDAEQSTQYEKIRSRVELEYMYVNVPMFITGEKSLDTDWDTYCADLAKRDYQSIVDVYNAILQND